MATQKVKLVGAARYVHLELNDGEPALRGEEYEVDAELAEHLLSQTFRDKLNNEHHIFMPVQRPQGRPRKETGRRRRRTN